MKKLAYVIIRCNHTNSIFGNTLIFKTIRIGFPTIPITVVDNNSLVNVCSFIPSNIKIIRLPKEFPHHEIIESIIKLQNAEEVIILDPDIIFWNSCELWEFEETIAGRFIPKFYDKNFSNCITLPRLHTSFIIFKK